MGTVRVFIGEVKLEGSTTSEFSRMGMSTSVNGTATNAPNDSKIGAKSSDLSTIYCMESISLPKQVH